LTKIHPDDGDIVILRNVASELNFGGVSHAEENCSVFAVIESFKSYMILNLRKHRVLKCPIQVQPVTRPSSHNHSSLSSRACIYSPITHVSQFDWIREGRNGIVISNQATQHTHFLLSTHPLIHDLTHACNFGPSATKRYYCHAQHTQLSVPFVSQSKFQNNISDYDRISSFKFYHSNTEPFNTLLCN